METLSLSNVQQYENITASVSKTPTVSNTLDELSRKVKARANNKEGNWKFLGGIKTFDRDGNFYAAQTIVKVVEGEDGKELLT